MHGWQSIRVAALLAVVATTATLGASRPAHAATTRTWTGAVNGVWSTAGNWSPPGPPVDGDSVVIGAAAFGKTLNNNRPTGLALNSLTINTSMTLVGNGLGIGSSITISAPNESVFLDLPITLNGDTTASLATGVRLFLRDRLAPDGSIALSTNGHRLTKAGGEIEFNGDIIGSGEVRNLSGNALLLSVPVSFSGTIAAQPGTRVLLTYYLFRPTLTCGKAPNARFVLTSAELSIACVSSIGSVSGSGTLEMFSADSRLTIAGAGGGAVFTGNVTGSAPSNITCCSAGSQTFRGSSSYSGNVFVNGGTLELDGAAFPSTSQFTVQGGGGTRPVLAGYGAFGDTILTTSNLSLGGVNGNFGLARFPSLQFAPDVTVEYEIKGSTPGTGFTQILMNGQIVLDNARLDLDFNGYQPPAGQSLTLVYGATALLDTFKNAANGQNLPEGALFTADGMQFKITYVGGAGHDVIITRQGGTATPTQTPTATPTATPSPQPKNKRFLPALARDN